MEVDLRGSIYEPAAATADGDFFAGFDGEGEVFEDDFCFWSGCFFGYCQFYCKFVGV